MITPLTILTLFITAYLRADAGEDAWLQKRHLHIDHQDNAIVRGIALLGMITMLLVPYFTSHTALFRIALICSLAMFYFFYGWWVFDRFHNALTGKNLKHIGSGKIDKWFKKQYGPDAYRAMQYCKWVGIFMGLSTTIATLFLLNDDLMK